MMMRGSIRRFSTGSIVDNLFNILQISSHDERQMKLGHFVNTDLQNGEIVYPNLVNDIIQRWAIEHPTKEALWSCETNSDGCQKLTFNDIYTQSCRIANVLTGKEFNLTPGKRVLAILPDYISERIFLQLACLQSGLVFCPYDPKDLTNVGIPQRIQRLAIDCIITDEDNLEIARQYTHNPLRSLKKGLITKSSASESLPVGWNHLMRSANNAESQYTKAININLNTPIIRFLSNDNHIIEYSQKSFNLHLILSAFWLNMNRISRLIWMKNQNEIISIAPWVFGSSIFYKNTENLKTMFNTFENHPIDTFCASSTNYQMLENQQKENKTHLKQLFSIESIDFKTKTRWHSLTNLHIRDNYANFNNKTMLELYSKNVEQTIHPVDEEYSSTKYSFLKSIPFKKFAFQYPRNQEQMRRKL